MPEINMNEEVQLNPDEMIEEDDGGLNEKTSQILSKTKKDIGQLRMRVLMKKNYKKVSKGKKWWALARAQQFLIMYFKEIKKRRTDKKKICFLGFQKQITVINQVVKNWMSKLIKNSISTLLKLDEE